MMYYFIYEVTNLINNKKYRGYHKTKNPNDSYLGSGPAIKSAVKKYGKENFKREILEYCETFELLIEREEFYIDLEWVKRNDTYNMRIGGRSSIGRITGLTEESKQKISETLKRKYASGEIIALKPNLGKQSPNKGKKLSEIVGEEKANEMISNMSKQRKGRTGKNKGKKMSEEACKINSESHKGLKQSEETKQKKSDSLKKRYSETKHHSIGKEPWNKGKVGVQKAWNKGTSAEKEKCPYCETWASLQNLKRWHFTNCKNYK